MVNALRRRLRNLSGAIAIACALCGPAGADQYDFAVLLVSDPIYIGGLATVELRARPDNFYFVGMDLGDGPTVPFWSNGLEADLDFGSSFRVLSFGNVPPDGVVSMTGMLPGDPNLVGLLFYTQAFVKDFSVAGFEWAFSEVYAREIRVDSGAPFIRLVTVNEIPFEDNGLQLDDGQIAVPRRGFTVDVYYSTSTDVDPVSLTFTSDNGIGGMPPGTDFGDRFAVGPDHASWRVKSADLWDTGIHNVQATIGNTLGQISNVGTFDLEVKPPSNDERPFDTKQTWWVHFSLDRDGSTIPDWNEDLILFGLGNDPRAGSGPTAFVRDFSENRILFQAHVNFSVLNPDGSPHQDPVNIEFVKTDPGVAHSRICVGGRNNIPPDQLPPGACETTGSAFFDGNNRNQEDDCGGDLGVHPRSMFNLFHEVPEYVTVFDPLVMNPVGNDARDPFVFDPGFDRDDPNNPPDWNQRWDEVALGVDKVARMVAFVLAQESGHSMGLQSQGTLPTNLLGGPRRGHSTSFHYDDGRGNFMSGNNSTPAPCSPGNLRRVYLNMVSPDAHFIALNLAYLREHLVEKR